MKRFQVGKKYGAMDTGVLVITILKRTPKMCLVSNEEGFTWRMRIREGEDWEYMTDSSVPSNWRDCYTYCTRFEEE